MGLYETGEIDYRRGLGKHDQMGQGTKATTLLIDHNCQGGGLFPIGQEVSQWGGGLLRKDGGRRDASWCLLFFTMFVQGIVVLRGDVMFFDIFVGLTSICIFLFPSFFLGRRLPYL